MVALPNSSRSEGRALPSGLLMARNAWTSMSCARLSEIMRRLPAPYFTWSARASAQLLASITPPASFSSRAGSRRAVLERLGRALPPAGSPSRALTGALRAR